MAEKTPLVLNAAGGIEELQSGDTIAAEVADLINFAAGEASLTAIDAVYIDDAGKLQKADASDGAKMPCAGINVQVAALVDDAAKLQSKGSVPGFSGLTPGAKQYVSPTTAGQLTETVPTGSGHYVQEIGIAINATTILLDIKQPIKRA